MEPDGATVEPSWPAGAPVLDDAYETFAEVFDAAGEAFPERLAYIHRDQRLTFGAWRAQADALAGVMVERGVRAGDVVLIALETSIDFAICYAAAQLAGAVGSGVNTRLGPREIGAIVARSQPALMILEDEARAVDGTPAVIRRGELAGLYGRPALGADRPKRKASDPAIIIWTSGTTGLPKGAWFDHRNLQAGVASAGHMVGPWEVRLGATPFAHAGYMAKVWSEVAFALTTVIPATPWSAADMLRLMVEERANVIGAVPTQWAKILESPGLADVDFSFVRVGVVATAPAPPALVAEVTRVLGCPLIVRYAMTESPSISGTRPGDDPEILYRTVGRPQEGVELEIVDEHGRCVPDASVGRIRVRGPCVMRGYWRDKERTAEVLGDDGWLLSGDYARYDDAGNIVLVGRTSEMYIRGGYNVYPVEVERVLSEHPAVAAAAVVGKAAPIIGEIGVAFVTPSDPSAPPSLTELRAWVRDRLADYKAPDELVLLEALPLTAMMKVDKVALAARTIVE